MCDEAGICAAIGRASAARQLDRLTEATSKNKLQAFYCSRSEFEIHLWACGMMSAVAPTCMTVASTAQRALWALTAPKRQARADQARTAAAKQRYQRCHVPSLATQMGSGACQLCQDFEHKRTSLAAHAACARRFATCASRAAASCCSRSSRSET